MVAAAAQLGRCHQAEVQAALSEGVPTAERRKILRVALLGAAALLPSTEASAADDQGVASSRMSYSRFLEYLDLGRVRKVDLYENGTIAIVEAVSPELGNRVQRVRVQLPGTSSELLNKFREKKCRLRSSYKRRRRFRCFSQPARQPRISASSRWRSFPPDTPQPKQWRRHARGNGRSWGQQSNGLREVKGEIPNGAQHWRYFR